MGFGFAQEEFQEHAEKAKTLPENTTNENKLILYGLYKQATVGPVNTGEYFAPLRLYPPDAFLKHKAFFYWNQHFLFRLSVLTDPFYLWQFAGRPGIFNMRDRAKWDAWKAVEGIDSEFMLTGCWFLACFS